MVLRKYRLILSLVLLLFLFSCTFTEAEWSIPFSDANWSSTAKDIQSWYGEAESIYDSIYGGDCYTYNLEYLEHPGVIKYMFDTEGVLQCVAWTYTAASKDDLDDVYQEIYTIVQMNHGDSTDTPAGVNNKGKIWRLNETDIIITVLSTNELHALQLAYIKPDSTSEK